MENNYTSNKFKQFSDFLRNIKLPPRVILLAIGFLSTLWFLIRVVPKPSRAGYPCMKAAFPLATSFVTYLVGITGVTLFFRKARERMVQSKILIAVVFCLLGLATGFVALVSNSYETYAINAELKEALIPNDPIGTAKGIFPGRVVWEYNTNATDENCSNSSGDYWYQDDNTDQAVISQMTSNGLKILTGKGTDSEAWDALFKHFNSTHGKGDIGYTAGEKIAIKVNMNGVSRGGQAVNTSPQVCYAILDQLINQAGVAQADISIGDPNCQMDDATFSKCRTDFPNVTYWGNGGGRVTAVGSSTNVFVPSDSDFETSKLPQAYLDATYLINVPVFKKHHRAGISITAKNHFGSVAPYKNGAWFLHDALPVPDAGETGQEPNGGYGVYRCFVDIMGHEQLGGKTLVYLVDGIWGSTNWGHPPIKWRMVPFNNDWPNSLFLAQDPVALESVCYDFLFEEFDEDHPTEGLPATSDKGPFPRFEGTDDYLLQAADPANWPSGFEYDPENDGSVLTSLGTHEHWNNATDKLYSRNLGTGDGIELIKVLPPETKLTPDNSGLLSEQVNAIFIDSFNIKWFATPLGISRFDDENWDTINTDNFLLNNNTKDMAYERTGYGHEIWVATDGGLSVLAFNQVDGVTSATTYHIGNSPILNDTVGAVGVDILHNRWIGTPVGLSVYQGSDWDSTKLYMDDDRNMLDLAGINIVDIQSYPKDSMIYVNTHGGGTLRYTRKDVDGITAASSYEQVWGGMHTNTVNAVVIVDTIQWFGTDEGAFRHLGNFTKSYWTGYTTESGLVSNTVTATEKDNNGIVWLGTNAGLSILTPAGFYSYTTDDGLIDPMINDIKKDYQGNIYLATNAGVEVLTNIPGSFTMAVEPVQASDLVLEDIQINEMTVSWKPGDGTNRIVFVKKGNEGEPALENNKSYRADSEFGKGSNFSGWYCVYNGSGTSVTVTELSQGTEYRVMVCEYGDYGEYITYSTQVFNNVDNFTTDEEIIEGIDELSDNNRVSIYPTPFSDHLNIVFSDLDESSIAQLYTMSGKLVKSIKLEHEETILNTSEIDSGVYIMLITNGQKRYSYKLVK